MRRPETTSNPIFVILLVITLFVSSPIPCHGGETSFNFPSASLVRENIPRDVIAVMSNNNSNKQTSKHHINHIATHLDIRRYADANDIPLLSIPRGGDASKQQLRPVFQRKQQAATKQPKSLVVTQKSILVFTGGLLTTIGLWYHREVWTSLFNKDKLQQSAVTTLSKLNDLPKVSSYSAYILGMCLWEAAGLSTIPVETAAGMVFGWPDGFVLNATGKLLGASLAFWLGRSRILGPTMEQQFAQNSFLQSIQETTRRNPLRTAFLLKFGPLPETIKNFGSAFLKPIQWWMFVLATIVHGWTFSALWTYLGVDTAARLEDVDGLLPPDRKLQILLALALVNGIAVSPLTMIVLCYNPSAKNQDETKQSKKTTTTTKRRRKWA
ncbi:SNARE associated golgi protein [Nitzschia inconspicua]|uniref:SNARE associated golgi protein n=1 Tax=Nitzschia inconspicua TaxID=303405 RepID=A0A9K3M7T4_9STRA|nr:SNARE associated golgi protein [Nitzschia inconspicua]